MRSKVKTEMLGNEIRRRPTLAANDGPTLQVSAAADSGSSVGVSARLNLASDTFKCGSTCV